MKKTMPYTGVNQLAILKSMNTEQSTSHYEAIKNMAAGKEVQILTDKELQDIFNGFFSS